MSALVSLVSCYLVVTLLLVLLLLPHVHHSVCARDSSSCGEEERGTSGNISGQTDWHHVVVVPRLSPRLTDTDSDCV